MAKYIYQNENWTDFCWENTSVNVVLGEVRFLQGKISGQIHSLSFSSKEEKNLEMLTLDVIKSSEIEGEKLNYEQVRSSIARHLGINTAGLVPSPRNVDGVVEIHAKFQKTIYGRKTVWLARCAFSDRLQRNV
jgi:Fic family protein